MAAPVVVTNATTNITGITATLNGTLTSAGGATCYAWFEYGITTAYGTETTPQVKTDGQTFTANITGLTPGTKYYFIAKADNTSGGSSSMGNLSDGASWKQVAVKKTKAITITPTSDILLTGYKAFVDRYHIGAAYINLVTYRGNTKIQNESSDSRANMTAFFGQGWVNTIMFDSSKPVILRNGRAYRICAGFDGAGYTTEYLGYDGGTASGYDVTPTSPQMFPDSPTWTLESEKYCLGINYTIMVGADGAQSDFTTLGGSYPSQAITRVTSIIHRYSKRGQIYTMEVGLGGVTDELGIPEWAEKPTYAIPPKVETPVVEPFTPPIISIPPAPEPLVPVKAYVCPFDGKGFDDWWSFYWHLMFYHKNTPSGY